jgi:tetratricopeptide (TPR) repeat protein
VSAALAEGRALLAAGRAAEAMAAFGRALQADAASIDARIGLAQAYLGKDDGWSAAAWMADACRVAPGEPRLWLELTRLLRAQQRTRELEPVLALAVAANPASQPLLQALAELRMGEHRYAEALAGFRSLLALQAPPERATLLHLGYCLEHTGDIDGAAAFYREALQADAHFMEAHVNLAGVLWRMEDFEGALRHAEAGARLAPQNAHAVRMSGTALLAAGRLQEAEATLRQALAMSPGLAIAQVDLAFTLLQAGQLADGFAAYEGRWNDGARLRRPACLEAQRAWRGPQADPLQGRTILAYAEQGLGDVLQFARYLPLLQAQGAQVVCAVQDDLVPLLTASFPGVRCVGEGELAAEAEAVTHHIALMDLAARFRTTLESVPAQVPYLGPSEAARARWRERLQPWAGRKRIGIAWSGSQVQVNNRNRAVPLSLLAPLFAQQGVQCFSLQKGDAGAWTDVAVDGNGLVDLTGAWADFDDSAAMVEQLDLVITVDTALAHLAGALARPVWILLAPNADWRWLQDREDSPWYPTARLFRRAYGEPRAAQLQRVFDAFSADERLSQD